MEGKLIGPLLTEMGLDGGGKRMGFEYVFKFEIRICIKTYWQPDNILPVDTGGRNILSRNDNPPSLIS